MNSQAPTLRAAGGESPTRLLVLSEVNEGVTLLEQHLALRGYAVEHATQGPDLAARAATFDVVLLDLDLAGVTVDTCRLLLARRPDLPIVVAVNHDGAEAAARELKTSWCELLIKPFSLELLSLQLERARAHQLLLAQAQHLRRDAAARVGTYGALVGKSPPMNELFRLLQQIGHIVAPVLISGEPGTGKELVARTLHQQGRRAERPFLVVDCQALPEMLLESQLFGHVAGAFVGAAFDAPGALVEADGGTVLLEHLHALPLGVQPKLLRALQEKVVRPLGGLRERTVDVRLIGSTSQPLAQRIEQGQFRADLYYRLDVVHVEVPPLRARGTDVLLLAHDFLAALAKDAGRPAPTLGPEAAERLLTYSWPGNVAELRECCERAFAVSTGPSIGLGALPASVRERPAAPPEGAEPTELPPLAEMEKRYILKVLEQLKGNKRRTAEVLGLDRSTLYRKLQTYNP